jgi:septin family protein
MYKQNNIPLVTSYTVHSGESGLGKSTLVNTLFKSKISRTACTPGPHPIPSTTEVNSVSHGEGGERGGGGREREGAGKGERERD